VLYYALVIINDANARPVNLPAFFLLIKRFQELFQKIKWLYEDLVEDSSDIERYIELMKATSSVKNGAKVLNCIKGDIEFRDVCFEYPSRPGEPVLKNMNLKISPNKITAIVGDSGAGKSTIAKLLMRLYDPSKGYITVDGNDIKTLDIDTLHKQIGVVNQSPDLFNASLSDNIGYGFTNKSYNQGQIEKASNVANCGFISQFRGKFDTFAGSRGANLSGGQKQRIAIARAAIRDPSVLILDEATSSLDAENESMVQEALERVMRNRTILIIAHRLSTIRNADNIVCMKAGEVVEQGTHTFLMEKKGAYFNLINTQIIEDTKWCKG
jgi:ABC-type multidrug transport system fused ATPase/permease subunit